MTEQLLTSEEFIKSVTNISDNLNGKVMQAAIREAQDIDLQNIIGSCLLDKLKNLCASGDIKNPENAFYKEAISKLQYFLAYTVIVKLCCITSYKIDNMGVSRTHDENIDYATIDEVYNMQDFYQKKADYFAYELQKWLMKNRQEFTELDCCTCESISANLNSSATSGIFLGGRRGKFRK